MRAVALRIVLLMAVAGCRGSDDDATPVDVADTEATCDAAGSMAGCVDCCQGQEPDGTRAFSEAVITACACADDAPCAGDCPDACGGGGVDATCEACVRGRITASDDCAYDAVDGCTEDGTCSALVDCLDACG